MNPTQLLYFQLKRIHLNKELGGCVKDFGGGMHKGLGPKERAINSFWEIKHQVSEGRQLRRGGLFPFDKLEILLYYALKRKVVNFKIYKLLLLQELSWSTLCFICF